MLLFLATVGFALYGFSAMIARLYGVFQDKYEDMSHGWPVVLFAVYVLWSERKELRESVGPSSVWGLLACLPCAAVALLGTRGLQLRFEQLGFIGLCVSLPWAFFGWQTTKRCVFPALFLLFTIPLATFLDAVTIHLRLFASGTAFVLLRGVGMDVVQQGTAIVREGAHGFSIDVAEPCSGLRSLFALMALTLAYAWYTQPSWTRRGILFACSVPLAVLGNVVRILSICIVAGSVNPDVALGFYHDYSGYIVFLVAILCMLGIGEVMNKVTGARTRGRGETGGGEGGRAGEDGVGEEASPRPSVGRISWLAFLFLTPLFVFQAMTPVSTVMPAPEVVWPETLEGYAADDVRYCQNERCAGAFLRSRLEKGREDVCPVCAGRLDGATLGENTILPADTRVLKKVYRSPYGQQFVVSAVIGGASKSSIHRPELCMPAQGYQMSAPEDLVFGGRPFRTIRLDGPMRPPTVLAYTFFNQAGVSTSSHVRRILTDTWDRSFHNRVDRWVMVTVSASGPQGFALDRPSDRRMLGDFLSRLVPAALPSAGREREP